MNTRRIIFLSIFGLYQLSIFVFTVFMESKQNDLSFLFDMFKRISLFKYGALLGLILLVAEFVWASADAKKAKQL